MQGAIPAAWQSQFRGIRWIGACVARFVLLDRRLNHYIFDSYPSPLNVRWRPFFIEIPALHRRPLKYGSYAGAGRQLQEKLHELA